MRSEDIARYVAGLEAEAEQQRIRADRNADAVNANADMIVELRREVDRLRAALPVLPEVAGDVQFVWDFRTNQGLEFLHHYDDVRILRALLAGKPLHDISGWEWVKAARNAEAADEDNPLPAETTTPDTSRVTFGTRHEGTGMVLLQHADYPHLKYGEDHEEDAALHRRLAKDQSILNEWRRRHAALAEVREALNTAEAAGVEVHGDAAVWCGNVSPRPDNVTYSLRNRARRYLAREVQVLVDQGLRGDDLNARVPYTVRDHRVPVEAADTSSEDEGIRVLAADLYRVGLHTVGPDDLDNRQLADRLLKLGWHRAARTSGEQS